MKKQIKILLIITVIILITTGIYVAYLFTYTYPHERYNVFKISIIKEMQNKIIATKNKIKNNAKLGKQEYLAYKKYRVAKYLYHHNQKKLYYLKKSAYNGYPKAEYKYTKYLISPIYLFHPTYNDKFNIIKRSQVEEYAKSIALMENSSKQGYKPAMFQMALLYLYGSYPLIYYTKIGKHHNGGMLSSGYYNIIRFSFKNKKKAKKILYKLASEKYVPAMIMVNDIYNKKIKIVDIYELEKIIHSKNNKNF